MWELTVIITAAALVANIAILVVFSLTDWPKSMEQDIRYSVFQHGLSGLIVLVLLLQPLFFLGNPNALSRESMGIWFDVFCWLLLANAVFFLFVRTNARRIRKRVRAARQEAGSKEDASVSTRRMS